MNKAGKGEPKSGLEIAVIGMSGRFPGAQNVDEFWLNLRDGIESISFFSDEELLASGVDPGLLEDPNYVKAKGVLEGAELFDASFFGFNAREAETMDPQQRLFLECAWEALESAGYDPERYGGLIGVYGGASPNSYFLKNLYSNRGLMELVGDFQIMIRNEIDYITTRVSYKMNLTGPAVNVQTACSTSLVAVCLACQGLLSGESDIALAGGCSVNVPLKGGYLYQDGGISSPDGHCRAFDAKAQGTIFSNAVGMVVLKRLEDALADGDCIHAIIKGSAINNDGSFKVGFTAPSIDGQAKVIRAAHIMAETQPETISYVETHGTATALGDPIEIAGLTQAFRSGTQKKKFCAIGSLKTNIGHADAAAGVAGLIKTILMLKNKMIPPSLHFENPNPEIDFSNSPFYVNRKLCEWNGDGFPRRAGVSSFGIGGTNAHLVVEEAPEAEASSPSRPLQLLLISAKTESALEAATINLGDYLKQNPTVTMADVAYTLQTGRKAFSHRRYVIGEGASAAAQALQSLDPQRVKTRRVESQDPEIAFMFPGQGAHYVNMGWTLYQQEPLFREIVDRCAELLRPHMGRDLRSLLYPGDGDVEASTELLRQTCFQQPAIFTIEYALAKLWEKWGVRPAAMIGHSIGEYAAACVAGVFSLEDALKLVAHRGRMMQELPGGAMLSIRLPSAEIEPKLNSGLSMAAVNAPSLCVVSGPNAEVQGLQRELEKEGAGCRLLQTSHAFHSSIMEVILKPFEELVRTVSLSPPKIPMVSTVTGTWINADEITNPAYWARQLRATVRFADGIGKLWEKPERVLLEVGPRATCATLARQQARDVGRQTVISSLGDTSSGQGEWMALLHAMGQLWLSGVRINWESFYEQERRRRLPLPTYPFERKRFWVEPVASRYCSEAKMSEAEPEPQEEKTSAAVRPGEAKAESPVLRLKRDLEEASGSDLTGLSETATFLEMGLDSLFLTQWTLMLKRKYGVTIPVHRLLGDLGTLDRMAAYLVKESPPDSPFLTGLGRESVPESATSVSSAPPEGPKRKAEEGRPESGSRSPVIENLIIKQLQVTSELLRELGNVDASRRLLELLPSIGPSREAVGPRGKAPEDKPQEIIGEIGARMETGGKEPGRQAPIVRVPRTKELPLSSGQQRLWYLDQLDPLSPVYNLPEAFLLKGRLDPGALVRALQEIVRRHEVLRVTYRLGEGGPVQDIAPSLQWEVPVMDFSPKPPEERELALAQFLESEALRPFDLSTGPLVRANLVKLAEDEHILFFMPHHSVFDGWSWVVFQGELVRLYEAFLAGKPSPLADLTIQYGDFALWQREWLKGEEIKADLAYWREKLSGELPVLELPADFARPTTQPTRGSRETLRVAQSVIDSLTELGRAEGATFFMVMMAAFQTLLCRYSGQEDIIVGSPISGRTRMETADLIGFFVNTLVFRTDLRGNPSFRELLRRVRQVCLEAYEHQGLPFERLVEEIQPERDLSRTPIYQAQLIFTAGFRQQKGQMSDHFMAEVLFQPYKIPSKVAQTDLTLWVIEGEGGLDLEWEYYTDLFRADTIKRMLKHFEVLLDGILAHPDQRIGDLPLLTNEEWKKLEQWNATEAEYPRDACIHRLFEDQAKKTPERIAVVYEGNEFTYGELNLRGNQMAHYLRNLKVTPEELVGIAVDRSPDMVIGMLGVLKAGGAYVPIDPEYPQDRVAFMLQDSRIRILLTQEKLLGKIPAYKGTLVCLDRDWEVISHQSGENVNVELKAENAAYVIYTSGSTGTPKGVIGLHRGAVNRFNWMWKNYPFENGETCCQKTSLSFVDSVWEIFGPLLRGVPTVIIPDWALRDPQLLVSKLANHRVSRIVLVPSLLRVIVEKYPNLQSQLPDLKIWVSSGEALSADIAEGFQESMPEARLINLYGSSEVSADSTYYDIGRGKNGSCVPIGRPIDNTQIHLLDRNLKPVPIGIQGEIYIGGAGLARGYFNRPELTSARFIFDPLKSEERLFKTGDVGRYLLDGNIEYLGRMDHQVKVRGIRIELGEIESILGEIEAIKQSVVMAHELRPGDTRLVAYFVPAAGRTITATEMRAYLRNKLPEYMIPQHFVEMERIPLTPSGKVARKELPSPLGIEGGVKIEYVPPSNEAERVLASIWQEVLGLDRVSAHDNFFDLGGHSLLCIQVIERIMKETGVRLSPRTILLNNLSQISQELNASLPSEETAGREEAAKKNADSSPGGFLRRMRRRFLPRSK